MLRQQEKVLIFSSREICYNSGNFFAYQLGAAFEELGFATEVCALSLEEAPEVRLESFLTETYRVVVDFNSMLPRMVLADGTPYLDKLQGPFFDYILDHPLFHYPGLMRAGGNLHAVVLDKAQAAYVKAYYPKVSSVHMLPLGGTKALYAGEKEPECRILFTGTYESPEIAYEMVQNSPEPFRGRMKRLLERSIEEPLLPIEAALREEVAAAGERMLPEEFALAMQALYPVELYVRDYFRKKTLDTLLQAGIPVTVMGEGWKTYSHPREHFLKREAGVSFGLSFERMAKAHILLNVSPMFNRGMHDRIVAGMANRAVVLTDENPYLRTRFTEGKELVFYSLSSLQSLAEMAERLFAEKKMREEIAERAYAVFEREHTWKCRAEQLLAWADACGNR